MRGKVVAWLLLSFAALAGCSRTADSGRWIRDVDQAHRQADQALEKNDRAGAVASLQKIVAGEVPGSVAFEDARAVRQDACFRLASIELESDRPGEAFKWADHGLTLGRGQDLFTANLLVARGQALQRQGEEVRAASDYHQALIINEDLLNRTLGPEGERSRP